jgi:MarR family transcriptional regulator, negative regulator of the multidrug operon emrRAB
MNTPDSQLDLLEANLQALSERIPDLPLTGMLLGRLIQHLGREMSAILEQRVRPFGLAEAEFRVLMALFSLPGGVAHPSDLCVRALQSPANMSRISDALVNRDLITRVSSARDRRRMVLRITEQGEELVRQLVPRLSTQLRELLTDFPEREQRELVAQLKRLSMKLREAASEEIPEHTP